MVENEFTNHDNIDRTVMQLLTNYIKIEFSVCQSTYINNHYGKNLMTVKKFMQRPL